MGLMPCNVLEDIKDKVLAHFCIYKHNLSFSKAVHLCTDCFVLKSVYYVVDINLH